MTFYDLLVANASSTEALVPGDCWEWQGGKIRGYGCINTSNHSSRLVHRVAYEIAFGAIPEGLVIDHVCRNLSCYRPSHLRAVTQYENVMETRSLNFGAVQSRRTHCPRGHELAEGNLVPSKLRKGSRSCLICNREQSRRWREKNRAN